MFVLGNGLTVGDILFHVSSHVSETLILQLAWEQ